MSCKHTSAEQILKELPEHKKKVEKEILKKYQNKNILVYSKAENKAGCSRCRKIIKYNNTFLHGGISKCPFCGNTVECSSYKMGRKKHTQYMRILVPFRRGNSIYFVLYYADILYRDYLPHVKFEYAQIYKVNSNELTRYEKEYYGWVQRDNFIIPTEISGVYGYPARYEELQMISTDLDKLIKGTALKYIDLGQFYRITHDSQLLIAYIREAWKYPAMEMMFKGGLKTLVISRCEGEKGGINIKGKTLPAILKSDMLTVKEARRMNMNMPDLKAYLKSLSLGYRITDRKELNKAKDVFRKMSYRNTENDLKEVLRISGFRKMVKYAIKQKCSIYQFEDYISQLKKLNLPLNNKNLFPRDFDKAHTDLSMRIKIEADIILRNNYEKAIVGNSLSHFNHKNICIDIAQNPESIMKEGESLHHCVAMYAERVADKRCYIYFVRKADEINSSYYTLELSPDGEVRQCRGMQNCMMTDEVKEAVEAFEKEALKNFKKKKGKAA